MVLIVACFFLSGLAGLIYEVTWARQLTLFLGITSYANAAVIAAYMAGLAAGSLYFGRRADRHQEPLRLFAWLEIGVGLYAAATPFLFTLLQNAYAGLGGLSLSGGTAGHLFRFLVASLALLPPTFLMGGTLPLLIRGFVTGLPELGQIAGRLYGINTMGAACGALLAGYLLLPAFGTRFSIYTGVVINLIVATLVLGLLQRGGIRAGVQPPTTAAADTAVTRDSEGGGNRALRATLIGGFALAGFAALLAQMAWIRALVLVVGGSVYAFTITLASFLGGIALGSLLFSRLLANPGKALIPRRRMAQASALAFLISLTLLLGLPLIGEMPGWFLAAYKGGLQKSFGLFQIFILALCFCLMLLPTLFMGALFPLVTVAWTWNAGRAGHGVGLAYAANTSGTILGAALGGLFILPWLGVHYSIQLAAGLYFLVATAYWFQSGAMSGTFARAVVAVVACATLLAVTWSIPPWNRALMVSGVFQAPGRLLDEARGSGLAQAVGRNELPYYAEGQDGIVAVRRRGDSRSLVINGKTDASSHDDLPTQVLLAQLPLALDRTVQSALVIGLGSGITAGSLATDTSLEQLRILEISREVVEASEFFRAENHGVLDDSRVDLVYADARNFLLASADHYDLIVSEPSNPWLTGISNLFTDEFIRLAKSRLNRSGVMTQWFHTYSMSNDDLRSLLKTFGRNFRYVSVWSPLFDDLIVIGSDEPHALSLQHTWGPGAAVRQNEWRRGRVSDFRDLVRLYLFGGDTLADYVKDAKLNSDNHPVIEFSAPRNLYADTTRQNLESIFEHLRGRANAVPVTGLVRHETGDIDAQFMNLTIGLPADTRAASVEPAWTVTQRLIEEAGRKIYGVVASERLLEWQEGTGRFQIRAEQRPDTWSATERRRLAQRVPGTAVALRLQDGTEALGGAQLQESHMGVELAITWYCPAPGGGFTHYLMWATLPEPGERDSAGLLHSQAARLHCHLN